MSMSTTVVGFRPPDQKWKDMIAAWDACAAAGVQPPKEVRAFFEDVYPADNALGQEVQIYSAVTAYRADSAQGFDVDLSKVPKDVRIIRFYNSW